MAAGDVEERLDARKGEEEGEDVEDSGEAGGGDGEDHCSRDLEVCQREVLVVVMSVEMYLATRILHLLAHRRHQSIPSQDVSSLQQTNEERPPSRPSGC